MTSGNARPTRVLFIGGVGRSGTTLIERTLDTDPRVTALGEVLHLWERSLLTDELCGCGERFSRCPFWTEVGERAFGGWQNVDPHRVMALKVALDRTSRAPRLRFLLGGRQWRADLAEFASYFSRLYRAAAEVSHTPIVIDSSKQASLPFILMHDQSISLRLLHCVRDARAVAYSWTQTVARPEAQDGSAAEMQRYSPARMSLTWMLHNGALEWLPEHKVRSLRLRYEDWVADPETAVARILQFCALPPTQSTAVGPDWVDLGMSHTCSGNPMRFAAGRVEIRPDTRWRDQLPASQRRLVTLVTGPLLATYHYLGSRR